jgi:hypothetical protein
MLEVFSNGSEPRFPPAKPHGSLEHPSSLKRGKLETRPSFFSKLSLQWNKKLNLQAKPLSTSASAPVVDLSYAGIQETREHRTSSTSEIFHESRTSEY